KQGYNVIFLFGVLCDDEFEKRKHSYYAGHDIVNCLDFVDVFVIPTVMLGLPERARKVLFVHDIYDSPSGQAEVPRVSSNGKYSLESAYRDELDYLFMPCTALVGKKNRIYPLIRKKPLCRIPGGYIKLDHNIRYFEKNKAGVDSIIYAPTVTGGAFANYASVPKYGEQIVEAMLDFFGDYRIIFRPHPHTLETEDVRNIAERFSSNRRFVFDSNASSYSDNYCRSAVMVTDMSGTGFTYAFMTLRPVVFFSHREDDVAEVFNNVRYFEDRHRIGYVATTIEDLKCKVGCALKDCKRFARRIRRFRGESIFNLGRAEDYFAENFPYIAEGKRHKDWQYVVAPKSQSEARLLKPLHDQINELIEELNSGGKGWRTPRIAAFKLERTLYEKGRQIEEFWRDAHEEDAAVAEPMRPIEQTERAIAGLTEGLRGVKSRWWFRLFFRAKKDLTTGKARDRDL
ncbi:MAG: CDP-glycerol glycerophosphotransferase family protein, partial [Planctomycetota bacterium]